MPTNLSTVVTSLHPSSGATATLVGDQVWVLFNTEIDENTVTENFFITGPESDTWSGPDMSLWQNGRINKDFLASPGLAGIVPGTLSFQRINLADLNVYTSADTTGNGGLYRTKAIFTPSKQLTPSTKFTAYLTGDEDGTDGIKAGIGPRSIFDPIRIASGSSNVTFSGTFTGSGSETYKISIASTGVNKVATFTWWLLSAPGTVYGPVLTDTKVFLSNGIYAGFGDGSFTIGDTHQALAKAVAPYLGTYNWGFVTGSGSIQTIPTTTSTSVIGDLVPKTSLAPTIFKVKSISPVDRSTNLTTKTKQVILEFTNPIDTTTVTNDKILMMGSPTNGDTNLFEERQIYKNITVSGNKIILDF